MRRILVLIAVIALVSIPALAKPTTHKVTIDGMKFNPAKLSVNVGDTVIWTNLDIVPHSATAPQAGLDSGTIKPGDSWKWIAKKSGDFTYKCSFHPTMTASIKISPAKK